MPYVTSSFTRLTRSARGELFNPLIYPFLLSTFAYGIGFTLFRNFTAVHESSLFMAMEAISPTLSVIWGVLAIAVIIVGIYVLIYDKPPIGKANCFIAWMLWLFAAIVYIQTGGYLTLFSVALSNLMFWTWQYFSLAKFRQQDSSDKASMIRYDEGEYDDKLNPKDSRADREDNRGVSEDDRTPYE